MVTNILLALLVAFLVVLVWFAIFGLSQENEVPVSFLVGSLIILTILRICLPPFWFWTIAITLTLFLMGGVFDSGILWICAGVFLCLSTGWYFLRPVLKPGNNSGTTTNIVNIPAVPPTEVTNVVWSGKTSSPIDMGGENYAPSTSTNVSSVCTNAIRKQAQDESSKSSRLNNGWTFSGQIDKKGRPRGLGVMHCPGLDIAGTFRRSGSAKGDVIVHSLDGRVVYQGGFRHYRYHGKGKLFLSDGSRYEGDFRNGEKNGYGREWSPDGSRYKGYYKDGLRHGRGAIKFPNTTRTWHVWKSGQIADRKTVLRARLDAAGASISSKTKERFERYLCFYELNYWWMTALVGGLVFFVLWFGYKFGPEPDVPQFFAKELRKEHEIRKYFWRGAAFGWHKRRLGMRNWAFYPTLLFAAAIFASQELLLFVPFPRIWLCFPTFPMASIVCIVVFAGMCIYDLSFGIGYDVYRFNWQWFWNPEYDEKLRNGNDVIFDVADSVRESAEEVRSDVEYAQSEVEAIFAALQRKHEKDDRPFSFATIKEAFGHKEEAMTQELSAIVRRVKGKAKIINKDGKKACDALNWFHVVFQRARNVSFEVLDESMAKPVIRSKYKREMDEIGSVRVSVAVAKSENRMQVRSIANDITDNRLFAGFIMRAYDCGALINDWLCPLLGKEPQRLKLRKDQAAAYESISKAVPKIMAAYAAIQEAADRLDALSSVIRQFYVHYGSVRVKLLGSPSYADYWRRRQGYKGRETVISDETFKAEFEQMLHFLVELTKRCKELDELHRLGDTQH